MLERLTESDVLVTWGPLVFISQFAGIRAAVDVPIGTVLIDLHC
jgi:hypothetical protein